MKTRASSLAALLLSVGAAHCGSVVAGAPTLDASTTADATPTADTASVDATPPPTVVSPSCDEVRARCGPAPAMFVRGHATGLTGLDGARARFAVRYHGDTGGGLNVPHDVVAAWARVQGGAFEACVCVPVGANLYPSIAAVVYAPGSTGETGRDVARAAFSQRYATLGDEDVSVALAATPSRPQAEAAVAAMDPRALMLTVTGISAADGARLYGGVVADERPVAAQVAGGAVMSGRSQMLWIMPGRAYPSERLALVIDRDNDRRCGAGDVAAFVRPDASGTAAVNTWLEGAAATPVCEALQLEAPREP